VIKSQPTPADRITSNQVITRPPATVHGVLRRGRALGYIQSDNDGSFNDSSDSEKSESAESSGPLAAAPASSTNTISRKRCDVHSPVFTSTNAEKFIFKIDFSFSKQFALEGKLETVVYLVAAQVGLSRPWSVPFEVMKANILNDVGDKSKQMDYLADLLMIVCGETFDNNYGMTTSIATPDGVLDVSGERMIAYVALQCALCVRFGFEDTTQILQHGVPRSGQFVSVDETDFARIVLRKIHSNVIDCIEEDKPQNIGDAFIDELELFLKT